MIKLRLWVGAFDLPQFRGDFIGQIGYNNRVEKFTIKGGMFMFRLSKRGFMLAILSVTVLASSVLFSFALENEKTQTADESVAQEDGFMGNGFGRMRGGFCGKGEAGFCENGLDKEQLEVLQKMREEHKAEMHAKIAEFKGLTHEEFKAEMENRREEMKAKKEEMRKGKTMGRGHGKMKGNAAPYQNTVS
jgi:hypothetical protein